MRGWVVAKTLQDGTKVYHARWRGPDGRQHSQRYGRKKDADAFLTDKVGTVHDGSYREVPRTPLTFRAYAAQWTAGLWNLKPSTVRAYRSLLDAQLLPAFGDLPLPAVTVEVVNAWLASRADQLRPKTLKNLLGLLHKILADAHATGQLAVNRLHGNKALRRPQSVREGDVRTVEVLSPAEVNRLLDAVRAQDRTRPVESYPLLLTAALTGCRLGELLALQGGDLDEAGHRLFVRRSVYEGAFYVPKTKASRRTIDVGDQLLDVLRGVRARQAETGPIEPTTLLFGDQDGRPRDPDQLRKRVWHPALAAAGLRHVTLHSLRHFFASMLIAQGESLKYVSAQLGHTSIQITVDRYGHLLPEERTSARRLEARLWAAGTGLEGPVSQHESAEAAAPPGFSENTVENPARLTAENYDREGLP